MIYTGRLYAIASYGIPLTHSYFLNLLDTAE